MNEPHPLSLPHNEQMSLRTQLLGSPLRFTQVYYKLQTGRDFIISQPISREPHIITIYKYLVKVFIGEIQFLNINIPPRYGKCLDIDTPILTRKGWKQALEVVVGDELVGTKGWVRVTGVFPQKVLPAWEVKFSDGQRIVCNAEHLWSVRDRYTDKWKTLTTDHIRHTVCEADGRKHWRIPMINGQYGEIIPKINPYLLGLWLGDGTSSSAHITTPDPEIIKAFEDCGHTLIAAKKYKPNKSTTYYIKNNGFREQLKNMDQLNNKHFPTDAYLWPIQDRIDLLQGLMDTDGTCGKQGQPSFTNKNTSIIDGFCYLINSLGGKWTKRIFKVKNYPDFYYTVYPRLSDDIKLFRIVRKQCRVSRSTKQNPKRFISNIKKIDPCQMICFEVDADDKLYAAGKGLILTHNTTAIIHFIAWALGRYPDSNFIYVSYSHSLAAKQTQTIRTLMEMPEYYKLIGAKIHPDISAKDNFETTKGGSVFAAGAMGPIMGRGAGIKGMNDRMGGCVVIDDIHKPTEVSSDTMRESTIDWYSNTLISRLNNPSKTPIISIGQRLHEDDLAAHLIAKPGWHNLILPAIDEAGNALDPAMHNIIQLKQMQEDSPYEFAAQYQQNPQPAGGGIFKPEWFNTYQHESPNLGTFITIDTAETDKTYNDATVFSFWGLHKIQQFGGNSTVYGLQWLDCMEIFIEPRDLEHYFIQFITECHAHKMPPAIIGIETKSTGVTLASVIKSYQGLRVIEYKPNRQTGSLINGFLDIQSYISRRLISLPQYGKHTKPCIEHCRKITANNTHRRDDIAVSLYYAVKMALIDNVLKSMLSKSQDDDDTIQYLNNYQNKVDNLRKKTIW